MTYPSNALFLLDFLQTHVKNALLILLFNQANENMGFLSISKLQLAPDQKKIYAVWIRSFLVAWTREYSCSQQLKIETIGI